LFQGPFKIAVVARWALGEALDKIVAWHKQTAKGMNARDLCQKQITEYMKQIG